MDKARAEELVASRPWHHAFEIFPGVRTPGNYDPQFLLDKLSLPLSLSGASVLDIGPADGFFSRELHKRGAEVVAVDYFAKTVTGFSIMEQLYGKPIQHITANIYDLPKSLDRFDYILCLGVIYHLPDICRAMHALHDLAKPSAVVFLESYVEDFGTEEPMARYAVGSTLGDDITNFWAPNIACMRAILTDAGFAVEGEDSFNDRCLIRARVREPSRKYKLAYGVLDRV